MSSTKISRRYAVALFELAQEGVSFMPALEQASAVMLCADAESVLTSSAYSESVKIAIFDKILKSVADRKEVMRLISLLISRDKISLLPEILSELEALISQAGSSVDAEVVSAIPLNASVLQALSKQLGSQIGKKVTLVAHEDPSLLGGLVIRIGDRKIDCSVKSKLDGMKRAIIG
ncbi:MAG: ATP synthase F1 subunit delta [Mariprofundaceae bacterium]|nr:ATP synthase F1 subunit delta [Mariprofundaceae bacterium]